MSDFKDYVEKRSKIIYLLLSFIGCQVKKSGEFKVTYTYGYIILCVRAVLNCIFGIYLSFPDNIEQIVFHFVGLIPSLLVAFKLCIFVIYHQELSALFLIIKEKFWFANLNCPTKEKEVLFRYINYGRLCSLVESIALVCAGIIWMAVPVIEMILFTRRNPEKSFKKVLPFKLKYPFHIDVYAEPWYEIEFFIQVIQDAAIVAGSCAMGGIYYHLVLNVCGQFKLIQIRVKNFNKTQNELVSYKEQERKLNKCIQLHQDTLNFCANVEIVMRIPLLLECGLVTIFVCTSAFIATMCAGNFNLILLSFLCVIAASAEIFLYCVLGTLLTTQGLKVAQAAYESDWYLAPVNIQKLIMFIIARGQRPVYLTGCNVIRISVETFESILRTAASYFTVLSSMKE